MEHWSSHKLIPPWQALLPYAQTRISFWKVRMPIFVCSSADDPKLIPQTSKKCFAMKSFKNPSLAFKQRQHKINAHKESSNHWRKSRSIIIGKLLTERETGVTLGQEARSLRLMWQANCCRRTVHPRGEGEVFRGAWPRCGMWWSPRFASGGRRESLAVREWLTNIGYKHPRGAGLRHKGSWDWIRSRTFHAEEICKEFGFWLEHSSEPCFDQQPTANSYRNSFVGKTTLGRGTARWAEGNKTKAILLRRAN